MSYDTGCISQVPIYEHMRPNNRMLNWAWSRKQEIKEQLERLRLESELMDRIIAEFETKVCSYCGGAGHVMRPIHGCECDGPRQHKCDKCNGTGEPSEIKP